MIASCLKLAQTTVGSSHSEIFVNGMQHDCQEFLNYIVNDISEELAQTPEGDGPAPVKLKVSMP